MMLLIRTCVKDFFLCTSDIRMAMRPDAKAIGRRIAWANVGAYRIPQAMRAAYNRPCKWGVLFIH